MLRHDSDLCCRTRMIDTFSYRQWCKFTYERLRTSVLAIALLRAGESPLADPDW